MTMLARPALPAPSSLGGSSLENFGFSQRQLWADSQNSSQDLLSTSFSQDSSISSVSCQTTSSLLEYSKTYGSLDVGFGSAFLDDFYPESEKMTLLSVMLVIDQAIMDLEALSFSSAHLAASALYLILNDVALLHDVSGFLLQELDPCLQWLLSCVPLNPYFAHAAQNTLDLGTEQEEDQSQHNKKDLSRSFLLKKYSNEAQEWFTRQTHSPVFLKTITPIVDEANYVERQAFRHH